MSESPMLDAPASAGEVRLFEAIRRAGSEWMSILDALEDLVVLEDAEGCIVRCNRAAAIHMKCDVRQAIGLSLDDYLWAPQSSHDDAKKARVSLRGSSDPFERTSYALPEGDRRVHLIRNVREQRRLEAITEGINVTSHLSFMAAGVRHELGNPMNSMKMALSVLRERLPALGPDAIQVYLDRMTEQVSRMEFLLQSLRSFSATEEIDIEPIDLAAELTRFIALSHQDFERRGVIFTIAPHGPCWVRGNTRVVQQALLNVVSNAADAKPRVGAKVSVFVSLTALADGAILVIRDDGCGMTSAQLDTLFKPFVSSKPHGTGIGLSIVRRLLNALGASIAVQSKLGEGTAVSLFFAQADAPPETKR